MNKKLLLSCLFLTVVFLSSCDKHDNASQTKGSEVSIKTVSMVTFVTMCIALVVAYSYRRR